MAISSIPSSLASLIDTTPLGQSASSSNAFAVPEASSATAGTATSSNATTLATDLATLLKALADGNVSDSQTALTQLEKDLGVGDSNGQAGDGSSSPLSTVLAAVSHLLSTGNTSGALQGLVGYLRQTASTQGNLFSTAA